MSNASRRLASAQLIVEALHSNFNVTNAAHVEAMTQLAQQRASDEALMAMDPARFQIFLDAVRREVMDTVQMVSIMSSDGDDDDDDEEEEEDAFSLGHASLLQHRSLSTRMPSLGHTAAAAAAGDMDLTPLFFVPGPRGFYALRPGKACAYRLGWYRNVGRLLGLSLLHGDIFPLAFSRYVLKFLLGRRVAWHDLAFFDGQLYESLRRLLVLAAQPEMFADMGLNFEISLRSEMGNAKVELKPGGSSLPVTADNVHQYVELTAQHVMVECVREPLTQMKRGLHEVIPAASLAGLTAEDLRLLLNGCPTVDLSVLKACTNFVDESGRGGASLEGLRKWFWEVVERMSSSQKQDFIYFWTSSPGLPATEAGFVPRPSVVVRPPSDTLLPTANTCISRLSIPLYSSKHILKKKLLLAILTKDYGFV